MRVSRLTALFGLAGLLVLSGCASSPPPRFYQLQSGAPALPQSGRGMAILLGPLTLADYLQREALVQRQADGGLSMAGEARWAGSLENDVAQLLLRQLAGQLDTSRIAIYPDRIGFKPEVQVVLTIGRLDAGPQQPAVLEAQWRLLDARGDARDSRVLRLQEHHDGSLADQVRAQSLLLQQLSEQLAEAIRPLATGGRSRAARRPVDAKPSVSVRTPANEPAQPAVPVRTDMEVFRF